MTTPKSLLGLNEREQQDISLISVGADRNPVLVIDNALRDPHRLRELALQLHFSREPGIGYYPGMWATVPLDVSQIAELVISIIGPHWGLRDARPDPSDARLRRLQLSILDKPPIDYPDMAGADGPWLRPNQPHVDPCGNIAILVYLGPVESTAGGTAFFRHRELGIESLMFPGDPIEVLKIAKVTGISMDRWFRSDVDRVSSARTMLDFVTSLYFPMPEGTWITGPSDRWEQIGLVEAKFNRLVAYPSWLMHAGIFDPAWFGPTLADKRMTVNVFSPLPWS
jgi:Family of unknown function (DUF6445)